MSFPSSWKWIASSELLVTEILNTDLPPNASWLRQSRCHVEDHEDNSYVVELAWDDGAREGFDFEKTTNVRGESYLDDRGCDISWERGDNERWIPRRFMRLRRVLG